MGSLRKEGKDNRPNQQEKEHKFVDICMMHCHSAQMEKSLRRSISKHSKRSYLN